MAVRCSSALAGQLLDGDAEGNPITLSGANYVGMEPASLALLPAGAGLLRRRPRGYMVL